MSNNPQIQNIVYALVTSDNSLFAACSSGIRSSQDGGSTWHNLFDTAPELRGIASTALAIQGNTIIAGVEGAIARSNDGGITWQVTALPAPPPLIVDIIFSTDVDGFVFAGTADDGIFVSADGGNTWTAWNFGLVDQKVNCLVIAPDNTVLVGTESGIFSSHNQGKTWHEVPFPMSAAPVLSLGITATYIFAGTQEAGLLYARHRAENWSAAPGVADFQGEAVHAIHTDDTGLVILTDRHLIDLHTASLACQVLHTFPDNQALTLAGTRQQFVIGFADGTIKAYIP